MLVDLLLVMIRVHQALVWEMGTDTELCCFSK